MKIEFKEILDTPLKEGGFMVASKIHSILGKVERIAQHAQAKQKEDGEFAKFHASNIEDWMQEIADMAQEVLHFQMKKDAQ